MLNSECLELFERYLTDEKKASSNTLSSYLRDVRQMGEFLDTHTDSDMISATEENLADYIGWLKSNGSLWPQYPAALRLLNVSIHIW